MAKRFWEEFTKRLGVNVNDKLMVGNVYTTETQHCDVVDVAPCTFIVNSNAALAAWATNASGNDFTHVLIKKGTWESAAAVNLTTSGTKVVVGEAGSLLSFTSRYGLRYSTRDDTGEYWMQGVNVQVRYSGAETERSVGFAGCANLFGCAADVGSPNETYGFYSCYRLYGCMGVGNGATTGVGFNYCHSLHGCNGTGVGTGVGVTETSMTYGRGFYECTDLHGCTGTGNSQNQTGISIGFDKCTGLSICTGTGTSSTANTSGSYSAGFYLCTSLDGCTGTGVGISGYGFRSCNGMSMCKPGATASSTAEYLDCYVSPSGYNSSYYAPSDTPLGGWNKGATGAAILKISHGGTGAASIHAAHATLGIPATYVVNSNAALAAWASNASGNDFTHVLIKKGTWESAAAVNLTTSGTKVVVGEAGSLLSFTSRYGLRYTAKPTGGDCWMQGVNVQVNASENGITAAMEKCVNLTSCTASTVNTTSGEFEDYCFYGCNNLTGCYGSCLGSSMYSAAFYSCTSLTACTGTGIKISGGGGGYGFYLCKNLYGCTGNGTGASTSDGSSGGVGFKSCNNLNGCTSSESNAYGFYACTGITSCKGGNFRSCTGLTSCEGDMKGKGKASFTSCTNLMSCSGAVDLSGLYGVFVSCRVMFGCYPASNNAGTVYYSGTCYMKVNDTIGVSDTDTGGYNRS